MILFSAKYKVNKMIKTKSIFIIHVNIFTEGMKTEEKRLVKEILVVK